MSNDDKFRECEGNYLDPDFDNDIGVSKWNIEDMNLATCEICDELYYDHEIINVDGLRICIYCAENIVDAWNKRNKGGE